MKIFSTADFKTLANPGVISVQLVSPHNTDRARVTITRVTLESGAENPRHSHAASEQTWIALAGCGVLLLADGQEQPFGSGEVAHFAPGDVHGFRNTGTEPFSYISVTTPPINFTSAYGRQV